KSNSVFGGRPLTSTSISSTGPSEVIFTRPLTPDRQLPFIAAAERTMSNLIFGFGFAAAVPPNPIPTNSPPIPSSSPNRRQLSRDRRGQDGTPATPVLRGMFIITTNSFPSSDTCLQTASRRHLRRASAQILHLVWLSGRITRPQQVRTLAER